MTRETKPQRVVGIRYEPEEGAPKVILKGAGALAEEILRTRHPVTGPQVVKNPELLEKLYRLPVDAQIGPELYHLVAIVLAHVFSVEAKAREGYGR